MPRFPWIPLDEWASCPISGVPGLLPECCCVPYVFMYAFLFSFKHAILQTKTKGVPQRLQLQRLRPHRLRPQYGEILGAIRRGNPLFLGCIACAIHHNHAPFNSYATRFSGTYEEADTNSDRSRVSGGEARTWPVGSPLQCVLIFLNGVYGAPWANNTRKQRRGRRTDFVY